MMQPEREGRFAAVGAVSALRPVEDVAPGTFKLAFICTANQFRSVLAEAVCVHLLEGTPAEVTSFGVLDRPGSRRRSSRRSRSRGSSASTLRSTAPGRSSEGRLRE